MYPRRRGHHGHRGPGLALALLVGQMAQVGFNNIPPVTLVTIIGQVIAFLKLDLLNIRWPSTSEVCISAVNVWYRQDFERIFLAALFHADEWHLYFNMVSLLWKGLKLEPKVGSGYFLYMLAVFTALTNTMYVALSLGAEHVFQDPSYISTCAVGFSGVLFALKVVATHMSPPGVQRLMGFIPVPSHYACWAELLLIHIMVPRASFVGHLAGILVGLMYVYGPLKPMMDTLIAPNPSARNYAAATSWSDFFNFGRTPRGQSRYRDWSTSDHGQAARPDSGARTHEYTGGMDESEQMQHAMRESLRDNRSPTASQAEPSAPPMDSEPNLDNHQDHDASRNTYNPSNSGTGLYPDLTAMQQNQANDMRNNPGVTDQEINDLRQRRLKRFGNQT